MKTRRISRRLLTAALLAATSTGMAGCKSGKWTMPGSNLFSSNREPDASLIAGNTAADVQSPASKYDPSAIASAAARAPGSTGAAATGGSPYGGANTNGNMVSNTAPGGGLAAQSNGYVGGGYAAGGYGTTNPYGNAGSIANDPAAGYQTGPYGVGDAAGRTAASTATAATTPGSSATAGLPNPYGGTYAGNLPTGNLPTPGGSAPNRTMPGGATSGLASGPAMPQTQFPGAGLGSSSGAPTTTASATSPAYPAAGYSSMPTGSAGVGGLPNSSPLANLPPPNFPGASQPSAGLPTLGAPSSNLPSYPSLTTPNVASSGAIPAANSPSGAGSSQPVPSAFKGATTLSGYTPGTTSRSTGYDFGAGPGSSASTSSPSGPQTSLPPNTASGSSSLLR